MECILEAHPVPDITWYQGQKAINGSSRIKMFKKATGKDTYLLTLEISNPTKADGGNYRCNAFNNYGESNANISLNFQGKSWNRFTVHDFTFSYLLYLKILMNYQMYDQLYLLWIYENVHARFFPARKSWMSGFINARVSIIIYNCLYLYIYHSLLFKFV